MGCMSGSYDFTSVYNCITNFGLKKFSNIEMKENNGGSIFFLLSKNAGIVDLDLKLPQSLGF